MLVVFFTRPKVISIFDLKEGSKRQRDAFTYLISKLTSSDIDVVIIQMPLNPLIRETFSEESNQLFNNYVQELADTYGLYSLNMQDEFSEEYFSDLTHLNKKGAIQFSKKIAEVDYNTIQ